MPEENKDISADKNAKQTDIKSTDVEMKDNPILKNENTDVKGSSAPKTAVAETKDNSISIAKDENVIPKESSSPEPKTESASAEDDLAPTSKSEKIAENPSPKSTAESTKSESTKSPTTATASAPESLTSPTTQASTQSVNGTQPKKQSYAFLTGLGITAACALLVSVGVLVGTFMSRSSADSSDEDIEWIDDEIVDQKPISETVTKPIKDVALIPQNDDITLALLKLHNDQENSCYSPLSIRYALAMLEVATDGETKAQISNLLGDSELPRYNNIADHLSVANSLWVATGLEDNILPSYVDVLKQQFGADFKTDNFNSANNINAWAKENTLGLLEKPLSDEDVKGLKAMLVNVLAIDMNWEREYWEISTAGRYFNFTEDSDPEKDRYTTMHESFSGGYGETRSTYYNLAANATVLAKDLKEYNGTQLQFVALMPNNLEDFIKSVTTEELNTLLSGMSMAVPDNDTYNFSFEDYIPKFKLDDGGLPDLMADLKVLGINDVFDEEKANFSKMTNDDGFFIDKAIHKTKFDFSEKGIKAAAITALGGLGGAGGPAPIPNSVHIVVSIHKPFMYLVRDKANGEIWFAGKVYHPNRWEDDKADYGRE